MKLDVSITGLDRFAPHTGMQVYDFKLV